MCMGFIFQPNTLNVQMNLSNLIPKKIGKKLATDLCCKLCITQCCTKLTNPKIMPFSGSDQQV